MIRSVPASGSALFASGILLLCLLGASLLYFLQQPGLSPPPTARASSPVIDYEITNSDIYVDWPAGGPDFDPRGKCPPEFFNNGFVLLCKRLARGGYVRFLYHKGKKLLYRIDKDVIGGKARIGLHWVESTRYSSRYRIADNVFKGGKKVRIPDGRGGTEAATFHYGQAVSKRRVDPGRELFAPTHIKPDQCPEWWDLFNFMP